jgi:anti-sigma B factor antagonist
MEVRQEIHGSRLVLTPDRALLCSGPAEAFESLLQEVLEQGHRHLIIDLEHVPQVDTGGVRALVRGHLTAQGMGGTLVLSTVHERVRRVLTMMRLDLVFPMYDSVDAAVAAAPSQT